MRGEQAVQLILNEEERGHGDVVKHLLKGAECLECLVAFAKASAVDDLLAPLRKALGKGLKARFAIGLDFFLTEPRALRQLFALTSTHALDLYLSDASDTFHPKLYAFKHSKQCSVIVGSANLTNGGLYGNYEASALIDDPKGILMASVTQHFDALVTDRTLVPATKQRIDDYERKYFIHDTSRKVADKRAKNASRAKGQDFTTLANILELMRGDDSEDGFATQKTRRKNALLKAKDKLKEIASLSGNARRDFPSRFDALIGEFHSGGLQRSKSRIAKQPKLFVTAVEEVLGRTDLSPAEGFAILHEHFRAIRGAGINLLTEILHTLDCKRFAVMNQNAVSGLALAGIRDYPPHPSKLNVSAESYARYCGDADTVRRSLRLDDFSELDALFNYAYWRGAEEDEAEI